MKTVAITGGSRGIGRAIAEKFADMGYNISFCYNNSEKEAFELLKELRKKTTAIAVKADVSDFNQMQNFARLTLGAFNKVDVLINNAGISLYKSVTDTDSEDWDRVFAVNAKGIFNSVKVFVENMISRKSGCIINISSCWGVEGASMESVYSASKAAVIGFSKALSKELGQSDIRVNCIAPGVIDTDMLSSFDDNDRKDLKERTALNRLGMPSDVAAAAAFLAETEFVTGDVLKVDGGFPL